MKKITLHKWPGNSSQTSQFKVEWFRPTYFFFKNTPWKVYYILKKKCQTALQRPKDFLTVNKGDSSQLLNPNLRQATTTATVPGEWRFPPWWAPQMGHCSKSFLALSFTTWTEGLTPLNTMSLRCLHSRQKIRVMTVHRSFWCRFPVVREVHHAINSVSCCGIHSSLPHLSIAQCPTSRARQHPTRMCCIVSGSWSQKGHDTRRGWRLDDCLHYSFYVIAVLQKNQLDKCRLSCDCDAI